MKNLLIILLFTNLISAQSINSTVPNSIFEKNDFKKAIINFNDGTSVEGLGKIKSVFRSGEEVIVFKIEEQDKDEIWTVNDATGITIIEDDIITEYQYLKVSKHSFPKLYEVVVNGVVKLYLKKIVKVKLNSINNPGSYFEESTYYLKKKSEEFPTKIRDNYIKSTSEYFKDCEPLVRKIKNNDYNYDMLTELVYYYIDICGEE